MTDTEASGTKESPWQLTTPPGTSQYEMYKDESVDPAVIVCTVPTAALL